MALRIYPPIGAARMGNDLDAFFIGPEIPGHPGFEPDGTRGEAVVTAYKVDGDQIKRSGARFRLFEVPDDGGAPQEANLPQGCVVEWTVHLINKKAAIDRPFRPPPVPTRPVLAADPEPLLIDPGPRTISGANSQGVKFDTGEYQGRRVPLGELKTDANQNLIVLGGFGFSSSPTNKALNDFYNNPGWHDDVADGPVTARVIHADGRAEDAVPTWVMVGPPDYAPEIHGVTTLYDIMTQVAIDSLGLPAAVQTSFTQDVFPLLQRARRLHWVNQANAWNDISDDWPALADASATAQQLRKENADRVKEIESTLSRFRLTATQKLTLDRWVAGNFVSDWTGLPQPAADATPDGMTRAALDSAVGQGFFPGIEAGIIVMDSSIYSRPFEYRLDHQRVEAGDLTALMALPWQADFFDCVGAWWPSQRPDQVRIAADTDTRARWDRGINSHLGMVHNFAKLGFISAQRDPDGNVVFVETQHQDLTFFV